MIIFGQNLKIPTIVQQSNINKQQRPPLRLPGFPQRVLPPSTENNNLCEEVKGPAAAASELPSSISSYRYVTINLALKQNCPNTSSWSLLQCQKLIVIYYIKKFVRKSQ